MGLGNLNNNWFTSDSVFNDHKTSREIMHYHFILLLQREIDANTEDTYQSAAHIIFEQ